MIILVPTTRKGVVRINWPNAFKKQTGASKHLKDRHTAFNSINTFDAELAEEAYYYSDSWLGIACKRFGVSGLPSNSPLGISARKRVSSTSYYFWSFICLVVLVLRFKIIPCFSTLNSFQWSVLCETCHDLAWHYKCHD